MYYHCKSSLLLIASILLIATGSFAQLNLPKWELGASVGAFVYQGDLTPSSVGDYKTARFGVTLHGSKILSRAFMTRTNLVISGLKADEANYDNPEFRKHRALKFRTPLVELSQLLVWNPSASNYEDRGLSPYLFAGIGVSFLDIKRDWSNFDADYFGDATDIPQLIANDAAHRTPKVLPVIPVGFGLRYSLSLNLAVNAEASYRVVTTDYLDGFSEAVNPETGDRYYSLSIGAIYRIGKKNLLDCPVVSY
jgi:hypothetical protein